MGAFKSSFGMHLEHMPWLWVSPGIAIMLVVLRVNLAGDGQRNALGPKGVLASTV